MAQIRETPHHAHQPPDTEVPLIHSLADLPQPEKHGFSRRWFARSTQLRPTDNLMEAQWGIHWYTPTSIILLFLLGIASAIAHHVFYRAMGETSAGDAERQQWVIRVGSGLAFLCKFSLAAVVGISRTQWVWVTLRSKFLSLGGIDALFGVMSDPTFFTNTDMFRRAKIATVMAITVWIFPITAILTPSTIWVDTRIQSSTTTCTIRTMLFEFSPNSTARRLCCENVDWQAYMGRFVGDGIYRYARVERTFILAAYSRLIAVPGDVLYGTNISASGASQLAIASDTSLVHDCGQNSTYTQTFWAPSISCTTKPQWNTTNLPWTGPRQFMRSAIYRAEKDRQQNILWVGFFANFLSVGETQEPVVIGCQSSVSKYVVQATLRQHSFQSLRIIAVDTLFLTPTEDPVFPDTMYMSNCSLFTALVDLIGGYLNYTLRRRFSDVILTTLFPRDENIPADLGPAIERMANRMMVSLLAIDGRGTDPDRPLLENAALQNTTCTTTKYQLTYHYEMWRLVSVYATSIVIALFAAVCGFLALHQNSVSSNTHVSTIVRTTRNPTLDALMGSCLGGERMSKELEELRLKLGEVNGRLGAVERAVGDDGGAPTYGDDLRHVALGIEGEVTPIQEGKRYC